MIKWVIRILCIVFLCYLILGYEQQSPNSYKISGFPLEKQPNQITCGPTSIHMSLLYYKKDVSLNDVIKKTKTQWFLHKGNPIGMTEPFSIVRTLKDYGFRPKVIFGDISTIKYYISQDKPVIVLVRSGKKLWHYMVAIGYNDKDMIFADPANGEERFVSFNDFANSWSFRTDLHGNFLGQKCYLCKGRGFLSIKGKRFSLCDICGGQGKIDYLISFMKTCEVSPNTMIVVK